MGIKFLRNFLLFIIGSIIQCEPWVSDLSSSNTSPPPWSPDTGGDGGWWVADTDEGRGVMNLMSLWSLGSDGEVEDGHESSMKKLRQKERNHIHKDSSEMRG